MPPHLPGLAERDSWNGRKQTSRHFTAKMTSFSTSAQCSASDSTCRISPEQTNQVRPKLPLLKILQAAGAQGEMFTVKKLSLWYAKKESCHISYCYYRCCSDSRYRTGAQYGYSKSRPPEGKITTRWLLLLYRVAPSLYLWSWTPKTFPECGKSLIRKVLGSSKTRDRANLLCSAHYRVPVSESFFGM